MLTTYYHPTSRLPKGSCEGPNSFGLCSLASETQDHPCAGCVVLVDQDAQASVFEFVMETDGPRCPLDGLSSVAYQ